MCVCECVCVCVCVCVYMCVYVLYSHKLNLGNNEKVIDTII